MKKLLVFVVVLLAVLMAGCEIRGYCEDDGRYYFTNNDGVLDWREGDFCNKPCQDAFAGRSWCPGDPWTPKPEQKPLGYCSADGLFYYDEGGVLTITCETMEILGYDCHAYGEWCPSGVPKPEAAKPLFNMQLLIKHNPPVGWLPYCIAIADGAVSVDWQIKPYNCGWIADNHPCGGPVYSNDYWVCDHYGYYRLPLRELLRYR